jgi:CSLREA domain-containing protein
MTRHAGSTRMSALLLGLVAISATASAATITVNSTSDAVANDGFCTLREAINSANGNVPSGAMMGECIAGENLPTVDRIEFDIPAAGVQTITPATALPSLTQAVVIDGYTQGDAAANTLATGTNAKLRIEIDGTSLPNATVLLYVNTDGATVRGLVMNNVSYDVWINGHNNNAVRGDYFNTDPTGSTFAGPAGGSPIIVIGDSNHIGGTDPGDRNVVASGGGGGSAAIEIGGTGNLVQGNYIGASADGTKALQSIIAITLSRGSFNAIDTLIGGTAPGAGNVIYASNIGINARSTPSGTVIQGNLIGTDATGSHALGSGAVGIEMVLAIDTTIGGSDPLAGNVISGFGDGIETYSGYDEPGTVIQGNKIGTDITGTRPIPNTGNGIHIGSAGLDTDLTPTQSKIGGTIEGEGNTIAHNCGAGIRFDNNAAYNRWPILGNSIHSNHFLGISLGPFAYQQVPNDDGMLDIDTGPNNLQNYPVITGAALSSGSVTIFGTLDSAASTQFRLEFFSGIGCHVSGYGEGRYFLGSTDVMTDASGKTNFTSPMFSVPPGHSVFTATATDPDQNTSEFSHCYGMPELLFQNGFESACSGSD